LVVDDDDAIREPEKVVRTAYTMQTPGNGEAEDIPMRSCVKTE
jgi:hypothetical protein